MADGVLFLLSVRIRIATKLGLCSHISQWHTFKGLTIYDIIELDIHY